MFEVDDTSCQTYQSVTCRPTHSIVILLDEAGMTLRYHHKAEYHIKYSSETKPRTIRQSSMIILI